MAVAMTVLIGAIFTISALLGMFVFNVSGWTILNIYGVFCAAVTLAGAAGAMLLSQRKPNTDASVEGGDLSELHQRQFDGRIAISEP
jgi:hypothetical protein